MELWKEVKGFPGYFISDTGRVRGLKGNIMKGKRGGTEFKLSGVNKSISFLMRENHRYSWIKDLEEGEEVRESLEFPGYYVSNRGRVFSIHRYKWLSPSPIDKYYYVVSVKRVNKYLHTLVGRTFLADYKEGLYILHKKEDLPFPEINYVENLWVGTQSENLLDMVKKGRNPPQTKKGYVFNK